MMDSPVLGHGRQLDQYLFRESMRPSSFWDEESATRQNNIALFTAYVGNQFRLSMKAQWTNQA
jgi:hypothetical protein